MFQLHGLYFSPDDAGAGGAPNNGDPAGQPGAGNGAPNPPPEVTFTEAQQKVLDKLFAERGEQGGTAALAKLFTSLNVKDADALKTLLDDAKRLKEAQMSEQEKATKRIADLEAESATVKAQADAAQAKATEKLMKASVIAEATKAGFDEAELNTVWMAIKNDEVLFKKIKVKDDDFEGIADVVKDVAKAHPKWLKQATGAFGTPSGRGAKPSTPTPAPNEQQKKPLFKL